MGFKVDSSFLRFLTMGALGVRRVMVELRERGFEPIELERYCGSNKIWATKVKRLRLPDLLCVRTGLRVEVRAKSDLKIRMSDAPNNPERVWDAGLRDDDVVGLIACSSGPGGPRTADGAMYFSARSLRDSVGTSKLGPPKSASEGAERDRTWPAVIPSRSGRVLSVSTEKIVVMMEGDGEAARKQTYTLNGKHSYVAPGDAFTGEVTMLAGSPRSLVNLNEYLCRSYHPLDHVTSPNPMDRYAAVKALRFREDLRQDSVPALEDVSSRDPEIRVALEAGASAAALGWAWGEERVADALWGDDAADMSMEAILILTELRTPFALEQLRRAAREMEGDERRQAAIWGLGKSGLRSYDDLRSYIAVGDENAAYHAIAGFGEDTPASVVESLVDTLVGDDSRKAAAASEALRVIASAAVVDCLRRVVQENRGNSVWAVATLGRLPPSIVRTCLRDATLLDKLEPMLLVAPGANWLANEDAATNMTFLLKQGL